MLNSFILSGTIVSVTPVGAARKVVIEGMAYDRKTKQEQPTRVQFTCFGDRTGIAPGTVVAVSGNVESREYNGKLYTDIIARDFEILGTAPASRPSAPPPNRAPAGKPPADDGWGDGGIPFAWFLPLLALFN